MSPSQNDWLSATDLERNLTPNSVITGQSVMVSAMFKLPDYETLIIPRHLLERYTSMFTSQLHIDDENDILKLDRALDLSMNFFWKDSRRPDIIDDFPAMRAEWDVLKIFFMWMLSGQIVRKPAVPLKDLSFAEACHEDFVKDVNRWLGTEW